MFTLLYTLRVMEFSTSITHTCTYVRLQHCLGTLPRHKVEILAAMNAEPSLKILKIQGALLVMFGNVNQFGTDMLGSTNSALSRS